MMTPETEVVDIVSETSEGDGEADLAGEGAGDTGTEVPESDGDETEVVAEEEAAEVEVVEDETEVEVVEEDAEAPEIEVRTDNRSPTGAFRGGHHGTVSTLATAGLGPVFGKLRSQGYGDIRIERMGDQNLHLGRPRRGGARARLRRHDRNARQRRLGGRAHRARRDHRGQAKAKAGTRHGRRRGSDGSRRWSRRSRPWQERQ